MKRMNIIVSQHRKDGIKLGFFQGALPQDHVFLCFFRVLNENLVTDAVRESVKREGILAPSSPPF